MAEQVPRISREELRERLLEFVTLDVRSEKDWESSDLKIQDAQCEAPDKLDRWINRYPKNQTYVLYCACQNENTSASLARKLIDADFFKVYALKDGWKGWREAQFPVQEK